MAFAEGRERIAFGIGRKPVPGMDGRSRAADQNGTRKDALQMCGGRQQPLPNQERCRVAYCRQN